MLPTNLKEKENKTFSNWLPQIFRRSKSFQHEKSMDKEQFLVLPTEIVESILERIDDLSILLRCRLVCLQWKTIVETMLEKQHFSHLPNLNNAESYFSTGRFKPPHVSPCLYSVIPETSIAGLTHLWLPPALTNVIVKNPFPNKSVTVIGFESCHSGWCLPRSCPKLPPHKTKIRPAPNKKIVRVFQNIGHHLTSLIFHDVTISQDKFCSILESSTNLKSLILSVFELVGGNPDRELNIPRFLTNLQVIYCQKSSELTIKWFLSTCSYQLTSLKLYGNYFLCNNVILEKDKFPRLQNLYIFDPSRSDLVELLEKSMSPPTLKYTTLGWSSKMRNVQIDEIIYFISKTSKSLISFKIFVSLDEFVKILEKCRVVYPKVRFIEMLWQRSLIDPSWEDESHRKSLLPWFPKLECAKVIPSSEFCYYPDVMCPLCGRSEKYIKRGLKKWLGENF
ncbi:unnamed protein product [Orchesella dallaii]|uniref:F-box domain-containing protein n=1 Tax=Orchesella dallaii TaxID=48710 RepID=A0ABP1RGI1_9HEXA